MAELLHNLSIIIPHFNSPDSLEVLLKSIGRHDDIEVIAVDDKSTVKWHHILADFPDVTFLENQTEKKGPGTARNIGLEHASGEWILFADSDDVFCSGWYDIVSAHFSETAEIVFFPPCSIDSKTGMNDPRRSKWYQSLCDKYIESGDEELLRSKFSSPCSKMIRRALIENRHLRFDEIMHWEDVMFSARAGYYAKSVTVVPMPIYCIIDHIGSMTTIKTKEANDSRFQVMNDQYHFWKEKAGYARTKTMVVNDVRDLLVSSETLGWRYVFSKAKSMRKSGVPVSYIWLFKFFFKRIFS